MTVRIDKSPKMNMILIFSRKRIQKTILYINTDMPLDAAVPDLGIMLKLLSYNSVITTGITILTNYRLKTVLTQI